MELNSDEDLTLRVNSPGGQVLAGWGIIAKMNERKGKTNIKVDGGAMSMAAMLCVYADSVECLDVSTFMLHRASGYVENPEDQAWLDRVNKDLRSKLESKLDSKILKDLTGYSIKDLFEGDKPVDLFMDAKTAKSVGLVDKINKVNPKEIKAFNDKLFQAAAIGMPDEPIKIKTMTIEQLKAEQPGVYAQIFALGAAEGVMTERDRVEACLTFIDADAKGVKEAIASGKPLSAKQMAEFTLKIVSSKKLEAIEGDSANSVNTPDTDPAKTAAAVVASKKEDELKAWAKGVQANTTTLKAS